MGLSHGKCEFGTGLSSKFFKLKSHPFIFDQSRPRTNCRPSLRTRIKTRIFFSITFDDIFWPKTQNRLSEITVKIWNKIFEFSSFLSHLAYYKILKNPSKSTVNYQISRSQPSSGGSLRIITVKFCLYVVNHVVVKWSRKIFYGLQKIG